MALRSLYLIRHGQHHSETLVEDPLGTHLTSIGQEQVLLTAYRLRDLGVQTIHFSSMYRTAETALRIADILCEMNPGIRLHHSKGLWECIPVVPGKLAEDFAFMYSAQELNSGEEHARKVFERYFKRAQGEDKTEIIVSHGNLIRYLVLRVLQVSPQAWINMEINNCGISQIVIKSDGEMKLISYNDVGHLPVHLRTYI
jgi:serine/threonine-protein phosphatase PGAM5